MRILFIGFVWPEPKSSAAGQNIISYIDTCLEQGWHTWFCSAAQFGDKSEKLDARGVETFACKLNCSSFNEQIANIKPDIVVFDRYLSFEQFAWRVKETCPNAMLVLDAEDLHFLRQARSQLVKQQTGKVAFQNNKTILNAQHKALLTNDTTLREMTCIYQADLTLVLSNFERDLLQNVFFVPEHQVQHFPFILNDAHSESLDSMKSFEEKQNFIFIGNFRHAPNFHAAKVLRENIWPTIFAKLKKTDPNISCHVYGAYMSPKAKQLENKSLNFYMHGYTEDQFEAISNARVMLAPITFGAGVKGKLLDAMRCNTPSVTTSIGAEGIASTNWSGILSDQVDTFIQGAIDIYSQATLWQTGVNNGNNILNQNFSANKIKADFIYALENKQQHLLAHRANSFLQQLLQQQQFLTSKYMSQWIEAKNRPN